MMNQFKVKNYQGFITVIDIMENLKTLHAEDEAYRFCYCNMCGYPRPDITTLDSFKMYYIHEAPIDFKDMTEFEKLLYPVDGFPRPALAICGNCLRELIELSYAKLTEPFATDAFYERLTRAERINSFIFWLKVNYWNLPHKLSHGRHMHDEAYEAQTRLFLDRFFSEDELSPAEVEGSVCL